MEYIHHGLALSSSLGHHLPETDISDISTIMEKFPQYTDIGSIVLYSLNTDDFILFRRIISIYTHNPQHKYPIDWDLLYTVLGISSDKRVTNLIHPLLKDKGIQDIELILKSLNSVRISPWILNMIHGDMLIHLLSMEGMVEKYLYHNHHALFTLNVLNAILNLLKWGIGKDIPLSVRNRALSISMDRGYVYLVDPFLNRDNIVSIISGMESSILDTRIYHLLETKGLEPQVFSSILSGQSIIPSNIWRKVLATAIVLNNRPLIQRIYNRYKHLITKGMKDKMLSLSGNSQYIGSLLDMSADVSMF